MTSLSFLFRAAAAAVHLQVWEEAKTVPRKGAPTRSWSLPTGNQSCALIFRALCAPWQTTGVPEAPQLHRTHFSLSQLVKKLFYVIVDYIIAPNYTIVLMIPLIFPQTLCHLM